MAYFGNTPAERFSAVTKDSFDGDGGTTEFTLTNPGTTNGVEVFVENVQQEPTTAYSVSGTTLTFTAAPVSGTGNIYVVNRGTPVSTITHPAGAALQATTGTFSSDLTASGTLDNSGNTGAMKMASGTTAQRPGTPSAGMTRYNSTLNRVEVYANGDWYGTYQNPAQYPVDFLVVAGGGGGGEGYYGGGGGAGGLRSSYGSDLSGKDSTTENDASLVSGTVYTITVGGGGAGSTSPTVTGTNGEDSKIVGGDVSIVSFGGGGGASRNSEAQNSLSGADGGCGGGAASQVNNGGSGTASQGFDGGDCSSAQYGAGGGGAGSAGSQGAGTTVASPGGGGQISTIISSSLATTNGVGEVSGSDVYFSGGGGGGKNNTTSSGGLGGGGLGNSIAGGAGGDGDDFTGGGGGGGGGNGSDGGDGGSGVVILRMATADYGGTYTGVSVVVDTVSDDTILTFKSSGTYTA